MVNAGYRRHESRPGKTPQEKWQFIQDGLSRFAGGKSSLNHEVYESEAATNLRNRGIAKLLKATTACTAMRSKPPMFTRVSAPST